MGASTEIGLNLVTGGTGLLGSHIVEQLRRRGRAVRALVRPGSDTSWLESQRVEIVRGDLDDAASLRRACDGVEVVYHAAARVGDWGPWSDFVRVSIDGTRNVVDAAAAARVKRLLHISSISAYGHVDGAGLVLDESAPLGRNLAKWSYYSRAKVEAEGVAWAAHQAGRVAVTVIRPSWLYGPRDRATLQRMIAAIRARKSKLVGDGTNRLNLTHAANVAEGAVLAAESDKARGEAYNCCSDGVITQAGYLNAIAAAIGERPVTASVPYGVVKGLAFGLEVMGHALHWKKPPLVTRYSAWLMGRRCFFTCDKIARELGWRPTISYEEGIPAAVEWYLRTHERFVPTAPLAAARV
ncbi:MAG: NAD-dependent epimerase/dehydratase family protein [Phycisphaerales bacterium]|nr:NAD-dependent epimerase/dehydratase family protein [Phycisphaerales bacterium]